MIVPRSGGYVPLRDYACLGDGRTVALVARDGDIDWWPQPRLDSPPLIAAILDPAAGGKLSLAPTEAFEIDREYVPDTNVLRTTYTTRSGQVQVTDALNVGAAGLLPWTELVRRIDGLAGRVPMAWAFEPGDRFGSAAGWSTPSRFGPLVHLGDQTVGVRCDGVGEPVFSLRGVSGRFEMERGHRGVLGFVATNDEPLFLPEPAEIDQRLDQTCAAWQRWSGVLKWDDQRRPAVLRSALALKLLIDTTNGSVAAAATTSLPERLAGPKNWDYRYAWVRDLSFTVDALMNCELREEVHHAVSWLLNAIRAHGPALQVFFTLGGGVADTQVELDAPGYRGSRPVRAGNRAAEQTQLGTYGDLFETLWTYASGGHVLGSSTGRLLADLADACCDDWQQPDSGIWELQEIRHYTNSKIGCWVALDRAVKLSAIEQIPNTHQARWVAERDHVREWIEHHCWSDTRNAYAMSADSDELDAAVLLAGRTGFDRGPRLAATIDAVSRELAAGPGSPLLYRYTGMDAEEGAFLACSYWMVEALTYVGRGERAASLFDELGSWTTDVGLLTEQADPDGTLLGNLPQALSHLALINAAAALRKVRA